MDISILKNGVKFQTTKPISQMSQDKNIFSFCCLYIARLRQEYIWTKQNIKTKYRTRKMNDNEVAETQKQLDDLKIDIKL